MRAELLAHNAHHHAYRAIHAQHVLCGQIDRAIAENQLGKRQQKLEIGRTKAGKDGNRLQTQAHTQADVRPLNLYS